MKVASYPYSALPGLQEKLLGLSEFYDPYIFLDSNNIATKYGRYDWLCAFGAYAHIKKNEATLENLKAFRKEHLGSWFFGHFSYDLKNQIEDLRSENHDAFRWPLLYFFVPENVIYKKGDTIYFESTKFEHPNELFKELKFYGFGKKYLNAWRRKVKLEPTTERTRYLDLAGKIKGDLQYGSIYELNYCIEMAGHGKLDVAKTFSKLNTAQRAPYSALYRHNHNYLLCNSPERFLARRGDKLVAQPIKGTAPRFSNPVKDEASKTHLLESEKERAENVMIVDLMRNDLSRVATKNSVQVEELFGVESFNAVHQMVSTISCELARGVEVEDILAKSFPMGSMTGAPKVKAMELIENYEDFARGLYSGSIGYISPDGDFDFNVVIRSLFYNKAEDHVAVRVGSAITIKSDAQQEYKECLLKAEKILEHLK